MRNKILTDSVALACVKIFTMASSILSTMVLSKMLPLEVYGTYSTGNLIITTATLISAFGLIDAVNFYYNGKKSGEREKYVNTIFGLIVVCGGIVGLGILISQNLLTSYFHNSRLRIIYIYIAFRPLLENLLLGLQNLQVSIGKAKTVAFRNAIMSILKLTAVIVTGFCTKDILTIFKIILIVDVVSVFVFYKILKNNNVNINVLKVEWSKIKEILIFCVPLGIYIQTNSLSRDLDKYVIGFFESTEMLAIYTNCSTKLPFDLLSGPLVVLLIPLLTKCIQNEEYKKGIVLFQSYLKAGYISTVTFGFGVILVASETIEFLYGTRYLEGIIIFNIYIIVDMLNFISYSLVLSAKGRTKDLMFTSFSALLINAVINYFLYRVLGFIGPAVATAIITLGVNFVLLRKSALILGKDIISLFDIKHVLKFVIEVVVLFLIFSFIKERLVLLGIHSFIILIIVGGSFVLSILLLNGKEIKKCFNILNNINQYQQ